MGENEPPSSTSRAPVSDTVERLRAALDKAEAEAREGRSDAPPGWVLKLIQRDRALLARFDAVRDADSAWSQTEFLYQEITHAAEFWLSQEGE